MRYDGLIEADHVRGVEDLDVGQVARRYPGAGGFAIYGPRLRFYGLLKSVLAGGRRRMGKLTHSETRCAVPGQALDHVLQPDVVANKILIASEYEDRNTLEHTWKYSDATV